MTAPHGLVDGDRPRDPALEICVCTHQPRARVLEIALRSIAAQTLERTAFRVLVIDNASRPALGDDAMAPLTATGIAWRLLREERLGNAFARERAIRETTAPAILFVDDDNELCVDYARVALGILDQEPGIGCLGGRLLRGPEVRIPPWLEPLRGYLGVHDALGETPVTEFVERDWTPADPPAAGMVVRREVARRYLDFGPALARLGRRGRARLGSCEDMLLARQAKPLGLRCSHRPEIFLRHHLEARRFRLGYLVRFFFGQGRSVAALDRLLGYEPGAWRERSANALARARRRLHNLPRDPRAALCVAMREAGELTGHLRP